MLRNEASHSNDKGSSDYNIPLLNLDPFAPLQRGIYFLRFTPLTASAVQGSSGQ